MSGPSVYSIVAHTSVATCFQLEHSNKKLTFQSVMLLLSSPQDSKAKTPHTFLMCKIETKSSKLCIQSGQCKIAFHNSRVTRCEVSSFVLILIFQIDVNLKALLDTDKLVLPGLISMKKSRTTKNRNDDSVVITFEVITLCLFV
jgi:hypothetical protein